MFKCRFKTFKIVTKSFNASLKAYGSVFPCNTYTYKFMVSACNPPILQFPRCFSQLSRITDCIGLLDNVKPCFLTEWNLYVWGVCV